MVDQESNPEGCREADKWVWKIPNGTLTSLKVLAVAAAIITVVAVPISVVVNNRSDGNTEVSPEQTIQDDFPEFSIPTNAPIPTTTPSFVPSDFPSVAPSMSPTATFSPTSEPTTSPTSSPTTTQPTLSLSPSSSPTIAPTRFMTYYNTNPVPGNPPPGYFNYDWEDRRYGPRAWGNINMQNHWLNEFGKNGWGIWKKHLVDQDPTENQCNFGARRQSPKNMGKNLDGEVFCEAHHEIRTFCGTFPLARTDRIIPQIWPHKLSLNMPRRLCLPSEKDQCNDWRPPIADYPVYSSSGTAYSDMMHYDIKVPGEHTIEGESFDAEIQMLHIHPTSPRVSSIAVVMRAKEDGHNQEFQKIIDVFHDLYLEHHLACLRKTNNNRWLQMWEDFTKNYLSPRQQPRQIKDRFDPYAPELMPTIFFYRYDGSITEPPCKDITWWVMEEPMIISFAQLEQVKEILFSHVDENCNPTSVHNADQSVARPVYELGNNRIIEECTSGTFITDFEKGRGEGRKC